MTTFFHNELQHQLKAGASFLTGPQRQAITAKAEKRIAQLLESEATPAQWLQAPLALALLKTMQKDHQQLSTQCLDKILPLCGFDLNLLCTAAYLKRLCPASHEPRANRKILEKINKLRCPDGGWNQAKKTRNSSVFGTWMSFSAHALLESDVEKDQQALKSLKRMKHSNGAYSGIEGENPSLPSTAMALCLQVACETDIEKNALRWIDEQKCSRGGFMALAQIPVADAMSTCLALLAAKACKHSIDSQNTEKFLMDLADSQGVFRLHEREAEGDCEASYWVISALGLLDS